MIERWNEMLGIDIPPLENKECDIDMEPLFNITALFNTVDLEKPIQFCMETKCILSILVQIHHSKFLSTIEYSIPI